MKTMVGFGADDRTGAIGADETEYKDALPFTSVLAIDFAQELQCEFDASRVHGECS